MLELPRELGRSGRLAGAVHPDHGDDDRVGASGTGARIEHALGTGEHAFQNRRPDVGGVLAAERLVLFIGDLDLRQNVLGGLDAEVGAVERLLERLERGGIDRFLTEDRGGLARDGGHRLGEPVLELLEEAEHRENAE